MQYKRNSKMTIAEQLKKMEITESGLEVRMSLTADEMFAGINPYYEIRAVNPVSGSCRKIARITYPVNESSFYEVTRHLFPCDTNPEIVGVAPTLVSADQMAHKETLLLANQISASNGIPVKDSSRMDKRNFIEVLKKINEISRRKN